VIFSINTMHEKEGGVKVLSSLRRHYPDQVCGYFLSNCVNWRNAPRFIFVLKRKDNKDEIVL